jgi:hypothetical protein
LHTHRSTRPRRRPSAACRRAPATSPTSQASEQEPLSWSFNCSSSPKECSVNARKV